MRYTLIFFSFMYCVVINAQLDCNQDSIKYMMAYKFIENDSINKNKLISVSDSIIDLDWFWFSKDLVRLPIQKEKIDNYRLDRKYIWFNPYYSSCINSLFCKNNKRSNNILFFSNIESNMLRADLLPQKKYINNYSYEEVSRQTVGQIYLIIFGEEDTIKEVFSHEIIYD